MQLHVADHVACHGRDAAKTILVADDDRTVRAVLTRILEADGFKVMQAERGEKCLFLSMEKSIDGFLVDLNMPGLDGVELCRRLRALERNRSNGDVLQPRLRCGDNGQVRTKRLIGEQRFPNAWCELFNFAVGVDGDPLKHINEVGVRVDVL